MFARIRRDRIVEIMAQFKLWNARFYRHRRCKDVIFARACQDVDSHTRCP
jgi:hypothetical protein